jgi:hypothetical protein
VRPRGPVGPSSSVPNRGWAGWRVLLGAATFGSLCYAGPASAAGTLASPASTVPAPPNSLTDGSFALTGMPSYFDFLTIQAPPHKSLYPLAGWVVGGDGVLISGEYLPAPPGVTQSVVLADAGSGSVTQTVKTTPGVSYRLSWYGAGQPGPDATASRAMQVLWDNAVVAAPSFKASDKYTGLVWELQHVVVNATSARSSVEFADATAPQDLGANGRASMVAEVSLAGVGELYVPPIVASTGKLVAVVRTPSGQPLNDPSLAVRLYGTWATAADATPTTHLVASGAVTDGQAVLQVHLPASLAHQTIAAFATLTGPGFLPVTAKLKIMVP